MRLGLSPSSQHSPPWFLHVKAWDPYRPSLTCGTPRIVLPSWDVTEKVWLTNILYVSEVLEKSSLFATLLIRKAVEEEVVDLGRLKKLLFVFDAGNHFRSYEQAHNTMVHIPVKYSQPCVTRYMVEKHGKGPCDSQLFSPMRRFLKQACMQTDFFAQDENDVVRCLQKAAADEAAANPDGPKWIIKVPDLPVKRPSAKVLTMLNCQINRSYCFETVLSKYSRTGVEIPTWIFSDANEYDKLQFDIQDKAPEFTEWKSGYFQNPTWQQPALELGEDNAITRKWQSQKHRPSSHRNMQALPARSLAVLQRRDENRSQKKLQKRKQKYKASKKERNNQSDVSLWEKTKQKCLKDRRVPNMENRRGPLNRRIKRYSILQQLNFGDTSVLPDYDKPLKGPCEEATRIQSNVCQRFWTLPN